MTSHRALTGLLLAAALGACAVQVDEPPANGPSGTAGGSSGAASGAGKGGTTSSGGKGGSTASAGGSSGATSGKGGAAGTNSAGSGGQASGGPSSGGEGGGNDGNGSSGSASGGTQGTVSCAGLPEWAANTNPTPALEPGDAFTYMNQRFELAGSAPVTYWNGECPPEASRPDWCNTNYAFTGPTPCS